MNTKFLSARRGAKRRFRSRGSAAVLSLFALVGLLAAPVSATVRGATKHPAAKSCRTQNGIRITDPQVCRGLAFYNGKTMTFVDIGSIGGPFDVPGIALQPFLKEYLRATVNISPFPSGNSIPGQDFLAHATPNGLTFGMLNPLNDIQQILTHQPGINFNPARLAFLGQNGLSASPLIAMNGTGYTNFAQMVSASKAGTLNVLTQNTGTLNTLLRIWLGVIGLHPHYIAGYAKLADEVQGLIRNDGPIGLLDLSLACPLLEQGKAVVLAELAVPPPGTSCRSFLAKAPTIQQLQKKYPPKTAKLKTEWNTLFSLVSLAANPLVTQTAVPGWKIATLRAAIKWSYSQQAFKTQMLGFGQNPTYGNPVKAKTAYLQALKLGPSVICFDLGTC